MATRPGEPAGNPNRIEAQWQEFAEKVGLKTASEIQQRECRKAFFAGAIALFYLMINQLDATDSPDEVTEADEQLLTDVKEEFDAYGIELFKLIPNEGSA